MMPVFDVVLSSYFCARQTSLGLRKYFRVNCEVNQSLGTVHIYAPVLLAKP